MSSISTVTATPASPEHQKVLGYILERFVGSASGNGYAAGCTVKDIALATGVPIGKVRAIVRTEDGRRLVDRSHHAARPCWYASPFYLVEQLRATRAALKQLVADFDAIPEDAQLPDAINVNEHWDAAREVLR